MGRRSHILTQSLALHAESASFLFFLARPYWFKSVYSGIVLGVLFTLIARWYQFIVASWTFSLSIKFLPICSLTFDFTSAHLRNKQCTLEDNFTCLIKGLIRKSEKEIFLTNGGIHIMKSNIMEEEDKEENQTLNMNIQITINGNAEIPIFHFIAMSTTQLPRYLNTIRLQILWPNE
mgnify:CR=1 FL=1